MWPNQLPHFSSQSPQVQLWKWPFSHLRGTDAELRVCTFVDSRFKLPRTVFVTLPQNMEEQLERDIDLNRTEVRLPCSCWRWGCSSPHLWWRRSGVEVLMKTWQEVSSLQVKVMVQTQVPEAGDHFHNFLPAMQGSGEVTAPPEIHNRLLALLNFEWLIIF